MSAEARRRCARWRLRARLVGTCCAAALGTGLIAGCATLSPSAGEYAAAIRRTAGGIPHIRAADAGSLGFGTGYAMAEDNVCILAEQYLTFGAERSRFLGPGDGNLERDFFYQLLVDRGQGAEQLTPDLEALFAGAAAGYNHYLRETGLDALPDARCRGAAWVREASARDVKRVSRADYALAYMLPLVMAAAPPAGEAPETAAATSPAAIAAEIAAIRRRPKEGGSNAIAIGRDAAERGGGMLLANPHMPWNEPFQRFYPMHQTLDGAFDVLGATLIGRPRVGFGHNGKLAWTSTVSTAKRFTFFQLRLAPGDPTAYVFDGRTVPLRREKVRVQVRGDDGTLEAREHTFYSTHFGALLVASEQLGWTREHAYAVRLVDSGWRGELSGFEQLRASSVRELEAIHDRHQFLTVNLIAADAHGDVFYGDLGPVPHLTDAVTEHCEVMHGAALDGSRSDCQWGSDPDAAAPGIFGPARLPRLHRSDFVTNSNDSYWLANPAQPLEGFAGRLGSERTERTLRTRSGLASVLRLIEQGDRRVSLRELQELMFANENPAGQALRDDLVRACRDRPHARSPAGSRVDLSEACEVLAAWDLRDDLDSRGAHLFRQFLAHANGSGYTRRLPTSLEPAVPFDAADPVATPSGLAPRSADSARQYLAAAVQQLGEAGIALDARLGDIQGVTRSGEWIPLHGGPEPAGIFNKLEAAFQGSAGYPDVTRWSSSWILAVEFSADGPRSRGLLTYSLSANPDSPHYADQTHLFSKKQWLELPYTEAEVARAALRAYEVRAARRP